MTTNIVTLILLTTLPYATLNAQNKRFKDQGITGPVHQANVNKVVFFSEDFESGEEDSSKIVTEYVVGESSLYMRAYFEMSPGNMYSKVNGKVKRSEIGIREVYYVNDEEVYCDEQDLSIGLLNTLSEAEEDRRNETKTYFTTISGGFFSISGKNTYYEKQLGKALAGAPQLTYKSDTSYTIKVAFFVINHRTKENIAELASGEVRFKVNKLDDLRLSPGVNFYIGKDREMEASWLNAARRYWNSRAWSQEVMKVVVGSDHRSVQRDISGNLMQVSVAVIYTKEKGKCHRWIYTVGRDHMGGGVYKEEIFLLTEASSEEVVCGCLNEQAGY